MILPLRKPMKKKVKNILIHIRHDFFILWSISMEIYYFVSILTASNQPCKKYCKFSNSTCGENEKCYWWEEIETVDYHPKIDVH